MSDIFISYKSDDRGTAEAVAAALEAYGWSVWWDRRISAGEEWDEAIERALAEARCVVVLWSSASIKSRWVRDEARAALDRGALIPARIEDVKPPLGFGSIQAADLLRWNGTPTAREFRKLVDDIAKVLGPPPNPYPGESSDPEPPDRWWLWFFTISSGIAGAVAAGLVLFGSDPGPSRPGPPIPSLVDPKWETLPVGTKYANATSAAVPVFSRPDPQSERITSIGSGATISPTGADQDIRSAMVNGKRWLRFKVDGADGYVLEESLKKL